MNDAELFSVIRENLHKGQMLKNYKELCHALNLPVCGGKQKEIQMKNLKRFFDMDRQGQKIIIKAIYEEPIFVEDRRILGNHSLYVGYIETVLLYYFKTENKFKLRLTKMRLREIFGLINGHYKNCFKDIPAFANSLKKRIGSDAHISKWHFEKFNERTLKRTNKIITDALDSLKNRMLIRYSYENNIMAKIGERRHKMIEDEKEREQILSIERETLIELLGEFQTVKVKKADGEYIDKMVPTSKCHINYNHLGIKYSDYEKLRNQKLQDRLGFEYIYRVYEIECNRKYLDQALKENIEALRSELNALIIKKTDEEAVKIFKKSRETKAFRYPENYVFNQKILAVELLERDEKRIWEFEEMLRKEAEERRLADSLFSGDGESVEVQIDGLFSMAG